MRSKNGWESVLFCFVVDHGPRCVTTDAIDDAWDTTPFDSLLSAHHFAKKSRARGGTPAGPRGPKTRPLGTRALRRFTKAYRLLGGGEATVVRKRCGMATIGADGVAPHRTETRTIYKNIVQYLHVNV